MTDLTVFLKEKFHFNSFKKGQEETIKALLKHQHTLTVLPTGTGKSLCYQYPSYLFDGQTIIVSPLISLMEDQVSQLRQMGEKSVVALNSTLDYSSKQYVLSHLSSFKFIFMSPETLNQPEVLKKVQQLNISLFVVDEAHCISEWGHDFRPSYLSLNGILKALGNPLTLALTATATESVKEDIKEALFSKTKLNEFIYSVNRPNIFYKVEYCDNKSDFLLKFLESKNLPGIIYFSSKKEAERVANLLNEKLPYRVAYYHGDLQPADRIKIQQQFIHDEVRILCATSAFGMGVNKENVRFVIHYHLPDSLENYVQESGRAGRDQKQSLSLVLYQEGDERIHRFLQEESFNQKKDLLFLKNKSKEELKSFPNVMTDIQKKWLKQLEESNWDWESFESNLNMRQFDKQTKIYAMSDYIKSNNCRREYIQHYFNNENLEKQKNICCDNCHQEEVALPTEKYNEKIIDNEFNAHELLKKLFLNNF